MQPIKAFGKAFGGWYGVMGGLVSFVGLLLPVVGVADATTVFLAVSLAGAWVLAASVIRQNLQLQKKPKRPLELRCAPGVTGCISEPVHFGGQFSSESDPSDVARFLRVSVRSVCRDRIDGCRGILTRISKDGKTVWGGNTEPLTFAPGGTSESLAKVIHKSPEFLDVVCVQEGEARPATPGLQWRYPNPFLETGDYFLSVTVTGIDVPQSFMTLYFRWTGYLSDSFLSMSSFGDEPEFY